MPRVSDDALRLILTVLLILGATPIGLVLACYFAWEAHNHGRASMRNVMVVLAVVAILPYTVGLSPWGLLL
jgi:hypothetical protein